MRADDPQAAEESLRKLGRRHTHVFRTTDGDPPRISLLQLTTAYVTSEMQQLPQLTELRTLRLSGKFTNVSMVAAGECRNLRELYLRGTLIRGDGIAALAGNVPLERLWLVEQEFDDEMARAVVKLSSLHTLILVRPTRVDATAVELLSHHPSLQEVRLMLCYFSMEVGGYRQIASIPNLRALHLSACDVTDDDLKGIARHAVRLRSLQCDRCPITDDSREAVLSMTGLEELAVNRSDLSDRFVMAVSQLPNLRRLDVGGIGATPAVLKSIAKCRNLESLGLAGMDMDQGTIVDFQWLGSLKALKSLDLRGVDLSRREMQIVAALPELEVLSCNPHRQLPPPESGDPFQAGRRIPADDVLEPLKNAPKLKTVRLMGADLSNSGLEYLAAIQSLRRLDCSMTLIDDGSAACFAKMQQLESLSCSATAVGSETARALFKLPRLRELDLSHTAVADDAFVGVGPEWQIRYLDLTKTSVTNRALELLATKPNLHFVIVNQTQVTNRGIAKMVERNPTMYLSRQFEEFGPKFTTHVGAKGSPRRVELEVLGSGLFIDGEQ
jgi:Leucine-rich repeat (LRR) protein